MRRILIVDDDVVQLRLTAEIARKSGYEPLTATGGADALKLLRSDPLIAALVLDLVMPEIDGMAVMETMRREAIATPIIIQTAHPSPETIVTAMRQGAVDYFVKPVPPERLIISLANALKLGELETLVRTDQRRHDGVWHLSDIVTRSPSMHRALALMQKAAKSPLPLLIEGEAGTGKSLTARIVHALSDRATKPFTRFDCAGHKHHDTALFGPQGAIVEANGGTLYLSAIGELDPNAQARLLRLLADGVIDRDGTRPERINVRIVAATGRRLLNLVKDSGFREDLFYRLSALPIYLPPLRDRRDDIEPLATRAMARFAAESGRRVTGLTEPALRLLTTYDWPGNIRQLETALYRAVSLSEAATLDVLDFTQIVSATAGHDTALRLAAMLPVPSAPVHIDTPKPAAGASKGEAVTDRFLRDKGEVAPLGDIERDLIAFALEHYDRRMSQVARALKIGRSTLYRKLREYGLDEDIAA